MYNLARYLSKITTTSYSGFLKVLLKLPNAIRIRKMGQNTLNILVFTYITFVDVSRKKNSPQEIVINIGLQAMYP
jgi:hypothetical protein